MRDARFIPSPPGIDFEGQVRDCIEWVMRPNDAIDPLVMAGMVHYQFETLHPDSIGKVKEPPVVYAESVAGSMHLGTPRSVRAYRDAFRVVQRVALDAVESNRLLRRVAKEYVP